ncbi:MAG TPA: restriction endonuclease [Kiritimatiellia bacterium]|nr:restriction endonuclease [Kiritimatiellia bacterium]HMP00389.1 restriction endonuclease [Kiritimatiellia bacterium]
MLPLMRLCADGKEHAISETTEALADQFKLSDDERKALLPSGVQEVFRNRVAWAKSHLKMAGLLEAPKRGIYKITERGLEAVGQNPPFINLKYLQQFPEYVAFRNTRRERTETTDEAENGQAGTPEETLESAHEKIRYSLAAEIQQKLKSCTPSFFERLVVEVIVKMGYGGTRQDAGKAIGKSGDGGIDGIIKEDKLGLDTIYIQAKRWEGTVGRPEIQKFVGALTGLRARKGLFISTSTFSCDAIDYVARVDMKVVLIDGETLAQLMIDHNVGVSTIATYELKKIDSDYFTEE